MATHTDTQVATLRAELEQRLEPLADEAMAGIIADVPAYGEADKALRDDVRAHILSHLRASVDSFGTGRDVTREDLLFVRRHAARRARRIALSDFVHAFYVGERVLWKAAVELARDESSRRAALELASHLARYFEVATTHAAEVYLETQEELAATGERIRRDLLEDLLAGRSLEPGPRLDAARAAGLRDSAACLVLSATPCAGSDDEQLLRSGAAALARATGSVTLPLAVVRLDEIVVVVPTGGDDETTGRITDAQRRLADSGLPLTVGISTAVAGLDQIPDAYREATAARLGHGPNPGVVALTGISAFEYLTLRPDATAGRLIAPAIHAFVEQDARDGGTLIATLRAYVAADLNARQAGDDLHIHVNTAHYRLARIAERTGCDLRRVTDLIEILIAARLADAAGRTLSAANK